MKAQFAALFAAGAMLFLPAFGWGQQPDQNTPQTTQDNGQRAKHDMHKAGREAKDSAKDTGRGVKHGTEHAYHSTKRGTKKAWRKSKNTVRGAARGAKQGAEKPTEPQPQR